MGGDQSFVAMGSDTSGAVMPRMLMPQWGFKKKKKLLTDPLIVYLHICHAE